MTSLSEFTVEQLRRAVAIKEQIETLLGEIKEIAGGFESPETGDRQFRKKMSFATRASVAAAARWAKARAAKLNAENGGQAEPKKKREMSAAGRARISAATKARWAKFRADAAEPSEAVKKDKKRLSAAGRAAIIAGTKARWAKIRAAKGEAAPKN